MASPRRCIFFIVLYVCCFDCCSSPFLSIGYGEVCLLEYVVSEVVCLDFSALCFCRVVGIESHVCAFPVSVVHGEWLPGRCVVFAVGAVGELVYVLLAVDCDSQIDDFSAWFQ